MSLNSYEAEIRVALQRELRNSKIRNKDIMEWSTGPLEAHDGEVMVHLENLGVWACVKKELDKR